ncbi:MAG: hypothetical protein WCI71_18950, partial [Bacteroidota bacterium]
MKNLWMRALTLTLILNLAFYSVFSQIYLPDGLRMPGAWNGWVNTTGMGGNFDLKRTSLGTLRWQTTFQFSGSTGLQEFKFTSGAAGDAWHNQWGNTTSVQPNTLTSFTYGTSGISNSSVSLTQNAWYTVVYEDKGYANARAIFMQTTATPVSIATATQSPVLATSADPVIVTIGLSATPSAEEKFYLRYTTNSWSASSIIAVAMTGISGTATIPAQTSLTTVEYYVFSTTITNPSADYDLLTIRMNNNNGSNFSYIVGQVAGCGNYVVTPNPVFPKESLSLTLTFDATQGNAVLKNYAYDMYIHTGVITNLSASDADWKYTKTTWGTNTTETKMTSLGGNIYTLTISDIRAYYGVPAGEQILKLVMVFRSDGTHPTAGSYLVHKNTDGSDILVNVFTESAVSVKLLNPTASNTIIGSERAISLCAAALNHTSLALY